MIACPKCGLTELRLHGTRTHISWRRRLASFWRKSPSFVTVAMEASCAACLFAFVIRESGTSDAPYQTAYEANLRGVAPLSIVPKKGREPSNDEAQDARPTPRPAPDPRNRKR